MNLLSNIYLLDHLKTLNVTSNWLGMCVNNPVIIIAVEMIRLVISLSPTCFVDEENLRGIHYDDNCERKKNVDGMFPG